MKKWIYVLVAVVLVLSIAVVLWCCYRSYGSYGHDRDEACVEKTLKTYSSNVLKFQDNLQERKQLLDAKLAIPGSDSLPPPTPIPTPIVNITLISMEVIEELLLQLECTAMPMPVQYDNSIGNYPVDGLQKPLPLPCGSKPLPYRTSGLPKKEYIEDHLVPSVGRIEIRNTKSDAKVAPVMLGSGFLIAPGTFAVNCHVIAPLLKTHPDLQLDDPEKLVVDFEPTRQSYYPNKEFAVTGFLGCSQRNGLDVGLIDICGRDDPSKPDAKCEAPHRQERQTPLQLLMGGPDDINTIKDEFSIVLGYADFDHFIDPLKRAIYDPFVAYPSYPENDSSANKHSSSRPGSQPNPYGVYGKFLLIDGVESEDECDTRLGIVLDTVSTTVGESGSVVIDLHEPVFLPKEKVEFDKNRLKDTDSRKPVLVGMHTCCSAYFENDYGEPPHAKLPCAQLHRTFHNQDISSWSILKDATLCPILTDRGVVVVDINDHRIDPFVCRAQQ